VRCAKGRRQIDRAGITCPGQKIKRLAPRISQIHHLGGLVKGFTGSVITGAAQQRTVAPARHVKQSSVPSAYKKGYRREPG
jgi:hypothetical protein